MLVRDSLSGSQQRSWVARHPFAATIGVVVTAGWTAAALPILASRGVIPGGWLVDRSPVDVERTAALASMAVLVPAVVSIAYRADGTGRLALTLRRMGHWRIGLRSWAVALVALPLTTIVVGVAFGRAPELSLPMVARQLAALGVAVLAINLWEEAMWAGLVQSRLEVHRRLPVAAFLTAVPFALVHVPLGFVEDPFSVGAAAGQLVALVILGFVVRLLIALVQRHVDDSILAVAVFHAAFNSANNEDGIGASVLGANHQLFALVAVLAVLAVAAVTLRGRLGRRDPSKEQVSIAQLGPGPMANER